MERIKEFIRSICREVLKEEDDSWDFVILIQVEEMMTAKGSGVMWLTRALS